MKRSLLQGIPQAKWESSKMSVDGSPASWVQQARETSNAAANRERLKSRDGMIDLSGEAPINVLEYNPKYNFILEKIRFGSA